MIIGRHLINSLKLILDFKDNVIIWNENKAIMKDPGDAKVESYAVIDSQSMQEATQRIKKFWMPSVNLQILMILQIKVNN